MFVDSDDWIEPKTCETAIHEMREYDADVVMWSYVSETENRSSQKAIFPKTTVFEKGEVKTKLHRRFAGAIGEELSHPERVDSLCPVWGKLYKRSLIEKSGAKFVDLSEIGTYEDGFFNLEVFGEVNRAVYLAEYLYHYRRDTTASVTSGYNPQLFNQWQRLYDRMESYIQAKQLGEIYHAALENRIALGILGLGLNITASNQSIAGKVKEIHGIISRERYRKAYQNLSLRYFPIHWKLFYGCAKLRFSPGVYGLLVVIHRIISK